MQKASYFILQMKLSYKRMGRYCSYLKCRNTFEKFYNIFNRKKIKHLKDKKNENYSEIHVFLFNFFLH